MRRTTLLMAATGLALLAASCGEGDTGDLLVHYSVGDGAQTCRAQGVRTISVSIENSERDLEPVTAACQDGEGELLVREIPADVYTVRVEGLDAQGNTTFVGERQNVRVAANTVTETNVIRTAPLNPGIELDWGGGSWCERNSIDHMELVVYFDGVTPEYEDYDLDCLPGLVVIEDLRAGGYSARLRAVSQETDEYTFGFDIDSDELVLDHGAGIVLVDASLEPCGAAGCSAP